MGAFVFMGTDPHHGTRTAPHWKTAQWISGCDMPGIRVAVTQTNAALWTDSRQADVAETRLHGTPFIVMRSDREGTPTIAQWLGRQLRDADSKEVGLDGMSTPYETVEDFKLSLRREGGLTLRTNLDAAERIWKDRPATVQGTLVAEPSEKEAKPVRETLTRLRRALRLRHADGMLISHTDDIAWALHLRPADGEGKTMTACYLLIASEKATLFIDGKALSPTAVAHLQSEGVATAPYATIGQGLENYFEYNILLDPEETCHTLYRKVTRQVVAEPSPIAMLKAHADDTTMVAPMAKEQNETKKKQRMEKEIKKPSGCLAAAGWTLLIIGAIIMGFSLLGILSEADTLKEPDEPSHPVAVETEDSLGVGRLPSGEWFDIDSISGDTIIVETDDPYAYYPTKHGKAEIGMALGIVFFFIGGAPFAIGLALVIYYHNRSRKAWHQMQEALKAHRKEQEAPAEPEPPETEEEL